MLVLIDNYDSFTYNLCQYLGELGADVRVVRNDAAGPQTIADWQPTHIVISPGPCTPDQAGISMDVVRLLAGYVPILGVCLGHQSIAQAFGARIVRAATVMHGKMSKVFHDERGLFSGMPNPFLATRYHSLVIEPASLPDCFEISAKTWSDEIMGVRHREYAATAAPLEGVQFHPESIETRVGKQLLHNFLAASATSATELASDRHSQEMHRTRDTSDDLVGDVTPRSPIDTDTSDIDASGIDASGTDTSGIDASDTDASGIDASDTDASGIDASGIDASDTDVFEVPGRNAASTPAKQRANEP